MSGKRSAVENAERRMKSWCHGVGYGSDVAHDVLLLLGEIEALRMELERERREEAES